MRRLSCAIVGALLASWAMLGSGCAGAHQKLDPVALNPGRYTVLLENEHVRVLEMRDKPGDVTAASIGPITTATARDLGFRVEVEAAEHTIGGLVEVVLERFASPPERP